MGKPLGNTGKIFIYRNNHDETFKDVSEELGLNKIVFAMGSNFGDIDNDGFLDMYFGTGNPDYSSLLPNKLFKNIKGQNLLISQELLVLGIFRKGMVYHSQIWTMMVMKIYMWK